MSMRRRFGQSQSQSQSRLSSRRRLKLRRLVTTVSASTFGSGAAGLDYPLAFCFFGCRKQVVAGQEWVDVSNGDANAGTRFHRACHEAWRGERRLRRGRRWGSRAESAAWSLCNLRDLRIHLLSSGDRDFQSLGGGCDVSLGQKERCRGLFKVEWHRVRSSPPVVERGAADSFWIKFVQRSGPCIIPRRLLFPPA